MTLPLAHDLEAEAQFDFGEATMRIAGIEAKVYLLYARLAYSTEDVVCAYARQDGHGQSRHAWGGVPAALRCVRIRGLLRCSVW